MKVFSDFNAIEGITHPVLTIGTFDGVHIGHQKILNQLQEEASKINGESVLFTFYPHPRMVLYPESHGLKLIQTQEEKLDKLARLGLDNIIVFPFTFEFSRLTALEFVRDFLVNKLGAKKIVIGYDHQFGKNREGNIDFLKEVSETYGFEVIEIPAQDIDEVNVSSTKIREALKEGNIELANEYLGEPFELTGTVVKGDQLGRTIGFPTANIQPVSELKLIPGNGVYAVKCIIDEVEYSGMMNIGFRPTVTDEVIRKIEVNLFDFEGDLYGKSVKVLFYNKWRDEVKFSGIDALKSQLKEDEKAIRSMLAEY